MTIKMARVLSVRPPVTSGMGLAVYTNSNNGNERPRDFSEALPSESAFSDLCIHPAISPAECVVCWVSVQCV